MDDFGVKYTRKEEITHLLSTLRKVYDIEVDWKGETYAGMSLEWNYSKGYVDVSMPAYVTNQLQKYGHPKPSKPQDYPFPAASIKYGKAAQTIAEPDTSPILNKTDKKFIKQVTGSFLY